MEKRLINNEIIAKHSPYAKSFLSSLEKKGITTIEQLIKCNPDEINKANAYYLRALIRLFKLQRDGECKELDILLKEIYSIDDIKALANNLRNLGFGKSLKECESSAKRISEMYELELVSHFSMEQLLKDAIKEPRLLPLAVAGTDFKMIYLDYLATKEKDESLKVAKR